GPPRIVVDRLDRVDRSPRDAPPACHQREQRKRQALHQRVFASLKEINVGRAPKRQDDDRNAILIKDELCSALNLKVQLAMFHAFDAADLCSHRSERPYCYVKSAVESS